MSRVSGAGSFDIPWPKIQQFCHRPGIEDGRPYASEIPPQLPPVGTRARECLPADLESWESFLHEKSL